MSKLLVNVVRRASFGNPAAPAELRFQLDGDEVAIMAEPDKGAPEEAQSLRVISQIDRMLVRDGVPHQVMERKGRSDRSARNPDMVCIRRDQVPFTLYPFLPREILDRL